LRWAAAPLLILLLLTPILGANVAVNRVTEERVFIIQSKITYINPMNGTRIWNLTLEDRTIGMFMNNTWQTVYLLNHTYPLESIGTDSDGNPTATLKFPTLTLRPGENLSFTVAYQAISRPRQLPRISEEESLTVEDIPKSLREAYCGGEGPWLVDDPTLKELAYELKGNETRVLTIVKRFILWIDENIQYPLMAHEVPQYPNETYARRVGDCDDKAILLITLCRICGIPAYLQIGCIYLPQEDSRRTHWSGHVTVTLRRIGWHGWAVVYIPPWGWLPVDLTFVLGGLFNPLNAIRMGAVTLQRTIQYMNITRSDYVASSRRDREFIISNGFYMIVQDEMTEVEGWEPTAPVKPSIVEELWGIWVRWIAIAVGVSAAAVLAAALYIRRRGPESLQAPAESLINVAPPFHINPTKA